LRKLFDQKDGGTMTTYPATPRTRAKRMHARAAYDHDAVHAILDAGFMCHVSYVIDAQPYCTPTIHWRAGTRLYWHGSSASRMLRALAKGTPACLTVSHLDGLVLARSGFNHSANYRSAMCFGTAHTLNDPAEKAAALIAVTDRFYPNRSATLRPITPQEVKATTVITMQIDEASAKVRADGVGDEETDLLLPIWAGVIPVHTVIGATTDSPHMPAGVPRPTNIAAYATGARLDDVLTAMHTAQMHDGPALATPPASP
jgi:uncharacterized protein